MKRISTPFNIIIIIILLFVCAVYYFWVDYSLSHINLQHSLLPSFVLLTVMLVCLFFIGLEVKKSEVIKQRLSHKALLFANISDVVITTDKEFRITGWNRHAEELYGWKENEVTGKNCMELLVKDFAILNLDNMIDKFITDGFISDEIVHIKKNGEPIDIWFTARSYANDKGDFLGAVIIVRNISHIKKIEKELEEQVTQKDKELANIFSRITDGIVAVDKGFRYRYVNEAAAKILNNTPEKMIGKTIWEVFPEIIHEPVSYPNILKAMETEENIFYEEYYMPLKRWLQVSLYADADGLSIIFRDVTEKKKSEADLKSKSDELSAILESITDGFIALDQNWNFRYANKRIGELTGANYKLLTGKNVWAVFSQLKDISFYHKAHQAMKEKFQMHYEEYIHHLNIWMEIRIYPSSNGISVFMRDITENKEYEKKLKDHEEQLTLFIEHSPVALAIFDTNMKYLMVSNRFAADFQTDKKILIGSRYDELLPEVPGHWVRAVNNCLKGGIEIHDEEKYITHNERVEWVRWELRPWYNSLNEIGGLILFSEFITGRKNAENMVKDSLEQVRLLSDHLQIIREEERAGMAREIHDELGQQLTGLKMDVSWINRKVKKDNPEVTQKLTETIELIDETIKTVRKIATALRPAILDDIGLAAAIEWQSREYEKRFDINIYFKTDADGVVIPGNIATALFRIFQESITNVLRHAGAKNVTVSLKLEEGVLVLNIKDDGKGFIVEQTGGRKTLGLLGMKERTLTIGGRYEVISAPGSGTVVQVMVPVSL